MDTKEKRFFEILGGPNKETLFDACKYAYDQNSSVVVEFKVAKGYTSNPKRSSTKRHRSSNCLYIPLQLEDIVVASIEHEDGTGDKFNLKGYCKVELDKTFGLPGGNCQFSAYYNAKTRTGTISFA